MPLNLMYITNRPEVARIAERYGVDRLWVDLESRGKQARQGHVNSVKSNHTMDDVSRIREVVSRAKLLVRVNPLFDGTRAEVDEAVRRGADALMLPMFRTAEEAARFVELVGGRATVILLAETPEAERDIDVIAAVPGVDEIHIGLNDLHLAYGMRFMFQLLANGQVEAMTRKIAAHGLPYGFGGFARLDEGLLPARHIIAEHYRLGSTRAILSRSFYDSWLEQDLDEIEQVFSFGLAEIREYERLLESKPAEYFAQNHRRVQAEVAQIMAMARP